MRPFPAVAFMQMYGTAGVYYPAFANPAFNWTDKWAPASKITSEDRESLADLYGAVEHFCTEMELTASKVTVQKMTVVLKDPSGTYGQFFGFGPELAERLADEMRGRKFFSLTLRETDLFCEPLKGWETIRDRFPAAISDIEEAQKCFAFSRYAGCVFHTLQIVELGLIALGELLEVKDPLPGWAATSNALQAVIRKKHPDRSEFEQRNFAFIEQMSATVEALKNAWRNKVSHAHGKLTVMTADFSPDVAEDILSATRAFMRRLATDAPWPVSEGESS